MEEELRKRLETRRENDSLRSLPESGDGIDLVSNDYLGLASSAILHKRISASLGKVGASHGATGSRLLSGNSQEHEKLENELADFFHSEAALFFPSGYSANLSVLSSVPQRGDTILYDELCHASIRDGIRLSFADQKRFRHNDMDDLESQLKRSRGHKYIVVESVYSMDGDLCELDQIISLANTFDADLIVDEAHSTGIYGPDGAGLVSRGKWEEEVAIRIHTFGKGPGIHGACVVGSKTLREFLINFARPFIYTTAPPLSHVVAVREVLRILPTLVEERAKLFTLISHFREKISELRPPLQGSFTESSSPIQGWIVPGNQECRNAAVHLNERGFQVLPVLSPTVEKGRERIRICLHSFNTAAEIDILFKTISEFL